MKKRILSLVCTLALMLSISVVPAMAAFDNVAKEKTLYTETIDAVIVPRYGSSTAEGTAQVGLALAGGASGWSTVYQTSISRLPSNAKIQNVKIIPGNASINQGAPQSTGAVVLSKLRITHPNGKTIEMPWQKTMETTAFYDMPGSGRWSMQVYGTNLGAGPFSFGNVIYKNVRIQVTYFRE